MPTDISKLAVLVTANASGLTTGLKGGEKSLQALGSTASQVGGVLSGWTGILGAVGVGFSLWSGLTKFGDAEQSIAKLDAVIRSTGEAAGFSSAQLQTMAADLAAVTTQGKSAIMSAEAVLATFTNIKGDEFKAATKAALDLSAVLGQDLQSSVIQIGKALNDPEKGFTALKRAGVSFTQSQVDQIKALQASGDMLGAQKIILNELSHEFGGAAEAAGATFTAQIDKAKGAVGSIATAIMGEMAPALAKMAGYLKAGALWVKSHKDEMKLLAKAIVGTVAAVAAYKTALFAITAAQRAWAAGQAIVLALQGPSGWAILAGAATLATVAVLAVDAAFDDVEKKAVSAGNAGAGAMAGIRQQMAAIGEEGEGAAAGIDHVEKSAKTLAKSVGDLETRLKEQMMTLGMTSHEAEVYKLKMEGATVSQLRYAKGLADTLDQMEAFRKNFDEMKSDAKRIGEEILTPFEKLEEQLEKINKLEAAGMLSADQADRASAKAAEDYEKTEKLKRQELPEYKNNAGDKVAALERRFTAGFTTDADGVRQKLLKESIAARKAAERTAKATEKSANTTPVVVSIN